MSNNIVSSLVQSKEGDDHKEQHEVHQHEAGLCQVHGPREGVEAVVVDDGQQGRGCQRDRGLEAAEEGVNLAEISLGHRLGEQGPDHSGHLGTHHPAHTGDDEVGGGGREGDAGDGHQAGDGGDEAEDGVGDPELVAQGRQQDQGGQGLENCDAGGDPGVLRLRPLEHPPREQIVHVSAPSGDEHQHADDQEDCDGPGEPLPGHEH